MPIYDSLLNLFHTHMIKEMCFFLTSSFSGFLKAKFSLDKIYKIIYDRWTWSFHKNEY